MKGQDKKVLGKDLVIHSGCLWGGKGAVLTAKQNIPALSPGAGFSSSLGPQKCVLMFLEKPER